MIETMYYKFNKESEEWEIHVGFTNKTDLIDAEKRITRVGFVTSISRETGYFHIETRFEDQNIENLWKSIRRMKFKETN